MRNTAPAKTTHSQIKDLTVIILAAGDGRRVKSYGSKSLYQVGETNLINHQIKVFREKYPNLFDIIAVLGFEADKVARTLPKDVRMVDNENYLDNNTARSIALGLRAARSDNVFFVYGDILFDILLLTNFGIKSAVGVDKVGKIENTKVGVTLEEDRVSHFAYGLPPKWAQVGFFIGKELDLIRKVVYDRANDSLCGFEVFNKVLEKGGKVHMAEVPPAAILREFNTISCIEKYKVEGNSK